MSIAYKCDHCGKLYTENDLSVKSFTPNMKDINSESRYHSYKIWLTLEINKCNSDICESCMINFILTEIVLPALSKEKNNLAYKTLEHKRNLVKAIRDFIFPSEDK